MDEKISSGSPLIDEFLDGGFEKDVITTIYGPAGTGKTTICLMATLSMVKDKKVIFIDTEGSFSVERIKQLLGNKDVEKVLSKIFVLRPMTFEEQRKTIETLKDMVDSKIGLVVVDTIALLYRA